MVFIIRLDLQVGLVIGKGGETIKSMQASSGARIQVRYVYGLCLYHAFPLLICLVPFKVFVCLIYGL